MINSLMLDIFRASLELFYSLIAPEETLSPSDEMSDKIFTFPCKAIDIFVMKSNLRGCIKRHQGSSP